MKHVMYAEKSLLMGDEIADRLLEYAGLLVDGGHAESITVRAISPDGNEVDVTMLLTSGAALSAETTNSRLGSPDNTVVTRYLDERIDAIRRPPHVRPEPLPDDPGQSDLFD